MAKEEVKDDVFKEVDFGELVDPQESSIFSDVGPIKEEDFFKLPDENDKVDKPKDTKKPEPSKKAAKSSEVDDEELDNDEDDEDNEKVPSHNDSQSKADSSIALVFAKFQNERGTLSNFDEEEFSKIVEEQGDEAALEYLYDSEVETRVAEVKKMYDQDIQEYIALKDAGVDGATAKTLVGLKSEFEPINADQLDADEAEDLRKKVLTQDFKNRTNLTDEEIEEQVEAIVLAGKDKDKAKKALPNIKKFIEGSINAEKQAIVDAENAARKKREESQKRMKDAIQSSKQILGQNVNKPTLQKVEKFLFEAQGQTPDGRPVDGITAWMMKNPEQARINLAYAIMTGLLDGNMDSIKSKVKTNVVKELHERMQNKGKSLDGKSDTSVEESDKLSGLKRAFGSNF